MDRMLGGYVIQEKIGAGGMAEVFRAYDPRLQRVVALKFLLPGSISDRAAQGRLLEEARSAARLNHPNICTIYEVGEVEGQAYIAMEFVEGRCLADCLSSQGFPEEMVLHYGSQISSALEHAHERHVVHRDLKCANVIIMPDDHAKVLDFGLAKRMEGDERIEATTASLALLTRGSIVGTLAYMAPELLRGEPASVRSDIWALGVMLFELSTGERPFRGRTGFELSSAILNHPLPSVLAIVRPGLREVIERCLAKDPGRRYRRSGEVRAALEAILRDFTGVMPVRRIPPAGIGEQVEIHNTAQSGKAAKSPLADPEKVSLVRGEASSTRPQEHSFGNEPRSNPWWRFVGRGDKRLRILGTVFTVGALLFLFSTALFLVYRERAEVPLAQSVKKSQIPLDDSRPSLAVLPFADMSPDKNQEYLSDGIGEELLNLLATVPELRVISRSSSFSFKGKNIDSPEIARRLRVRHVLEGSVRKSGNRVRVVARLIDARSDTQLWSQTWDRQLNDIFAVEDEIAAAVVRQLKIKLLGEVPRTKTVSPEAYALFLQARTVSRQGTPEGWAQSSALYQQALALQPSYAPAWDGLATNYMNQTGSGLRPVAEGVPIAREAVEKALALDPSFAPAHASLAWIAMNFDFDLAAAAGHYEHALVIAPANTEIMRNAATLAQYLGRLDIAMELGRYVVAQDPIDPTGYFSLGTAEYYAGRTDEAITSMRTVLRLAPRHINAQATIGEALLAKGEPKAALVAIEKESSEIWRQICLPMAYHVLGRKSESDAAVTKLIRKHEKDAPYNIAYVLAYRGETDRAFAWLEKAVASGDPGLLDIAVQPEFASVRTDPRWLPFLRRLGRAPEQLAAIPFKVKPPH